MNKAFIYVFDKAAREKLISLGYQLVKENPKDLIYVFENKDTIVFEESGIQAVFSNTLTF